MTEASEDQAAIARALAPITPDPAGRPRPNRPKRSKRSTLARRFRRRPRPRRVEVPERTTALEPSRRVGRPRRAARAMRRHPFRTALATMAVVLLLPLLLCVGCWWWVRAATGPIDNALTAPNAPVAIVFGAGLRPDGTPSDFLAARLQMGADLYLAGKVDVLLVSGDNSRTDYDETSAMADWLVEAGVPRARIVEDFAGFDTWDSCSRAHRIFGVDEALIVTQSFHLPRATYLCQHAGIESHAVAAATPGGATLWNQLRELPASVKAVADGIRRPDPHHLGPHEPGVDDALAGANGGT